MFVVGGANISGSVRPEDVDGRTLDVRQRFRKYYIKINVVLALCPSICFLTG